MSGVDVLAVMDDAIEVLLDERSGKAAINLDAARASVAELIEAAERIADHYDISGYGDMAWKDLALEMAEVARTALSRVRGAQ